MEYTAGTVVFNDWIITREIGQGAAGKVYEIKKNAYEEEDIRSALKIIRIPRTPSEIKSIMSEGMSEKDITCYYKEFVDEILREIKIMVSLKEHPNIVTYEDHCIIPHQESIGWDILIKMELLSPLQEWQIEHPLQEEDIIRLGCEISSALAYAAEHGLVHRDVKPGNIFVNSLGQFKLGDFGIARTIEKTMGGLSKKGTESYMAPEVYLGKKYNAQVDIYSLGIVLYRFLNNSRLPFYPPATERISYSDRENALVKRIQGLPVPEPLNGSPQLKKVVLKACEYLPEKRYASMKEMHQALLRLQDDEQKTKNTGKVLAGIAISAIVISGLAMAFGSNRLKMTESEPVTTETESESATTEAVTETESESAMTEAVTETESEPAATEAVTETESEPVATETVTETESESVMTESETENAYAAVSAENDLSRYFGCTTDEIKEKFGTPNDEYWSMGATHLVYDDYQFDSMDTTNGEECISEIWLRNNEEEYNLCGVQAQMSEAEAAEALQANGFYRLETGIFYNGTDQFVRLEKDGEYKRKSNVTTEWIDAGTLQISATKLKESRHPEKKEVFQYMKCKIERVIQDIDGLDVYAASTQTVIAENDGVQFVAAMSGGEIEQAVIVSITVKGEDSPYCLYGITSEDSDSAEWYLPFSEGGSGELLDLAGNVLYLRINCDDKSSVELSDYNLSRTFLEINNAGKTATEKIYAETDTSENNSFETESIGDGEVASNDDTNYGNIPVVGENGEYEYDCIEFGRYPQNDVAGEKEDPILWRILEFISKDDEVYARLSADTNLDVGQYDANNKTNWNDCDLNEWLNTEFMDKAFSDSEREVLVTDDNMNGKIYIPSEDMISRFSTEFWQRKNTAYVAAGGWIETKEMNVEGTNGWYWLQGGKRFVNGTVEEYHTDSKHGAVCPMITVNIKDMDTLTIQ